MLSANIMNPQKIWKSSSKLSHPVSSSRRREILAFHWLSLLGLGCPPKCSINTGRSHLIGMPLWAAFFSTWRQSLNCVNKPQAVWEEGNWPPWRRRRTVANNTFPRLLLGSSPWKTAIEKWDWAPFLLNCDWWPTYIFNRRSKLQFISYYFVSRKLLFLSSRKDLSDARQIFFNLICICRCPKRNPDGDCLLWRHARYLRTCVYVYFFSPVFWKPHFSGSATIPAEGTNRPFR